MMDYSGVEHSSLVDETQQKIQQLEGALDQIHGVKKTLKDNATQVKSQISTTFSRQMELMRNREVWLLGQVEVIEQAKEEVLRTQQDDYCHLLGGLQTSLEYQDGCPQGSLNRQLSTSLDKLDWLNLKPKETPHIGFRADVAELGGVIRRFGRVDSHSLALENAFVDPDTCSASLPRTFEDYGDDEHHVLYKTLADVKKQQSNDESIDVKIPKLNKPFAQWLSYTPTTTPTPSSEGQFGFPPAEGMSEEVEEWLSRPRGSAHSLQHWLHEIKQEVECEEDEDDFELLSPPHTRSMSECSDPAEILKLAEEKQKAFAALANSMSETSPEFCYFGAIKDAPADNWLVGNQASPANSEDWEDLVPAKAAIQDMKTWLVDYNQECETASQSITLCGESQCCSEMTGMDIEDLGAMGCVDTELIEAELRESSAKTTWLYQMETEEKEVDELEQMEGVCRANETCRSFTDCVCDKNCSEQLPNYGRAMLKLSPSTQEWLYQPYSPEIMEDIKESPLFSYFEYMSKNNSDWLIPNTGVNEEKPCDIFPVFHQEAPSGSWLVEAGEKQKGEGSVLQQMVQITTSDNSAWLLAANTQMCMEIPEQICPVLQHMNGSDDDLWLLTPVVTETKVCQEERVCSAVQHMDQICSSDNAGWLLAPVRINRHDEADECVTLDIKSLDHAAWLLPYTQPPSDTSAISIPDLASPHLDQSDNQKWLLTSSPKSSSEPETIVFPNFHHNKSDSSEWILNSTQPKQQTEALFPDFRQIKSDFNEWVLKPILEEAAPVAAEFAKLVIEERNENEWLAYSSSSAKPSSDDGLADFFKTYRKNQEQETWLLSPTANNNSENKPNQDNISENKHVFSKEECFKAWLKQEELAPEEDMEDDSIWLLRKEAANIKKGEDEKKPEQPDNKHEAGFIEWLIGSRFVKL